MAGLGIEHELLAPPLVTCGTLTGGASTNVAPGAEVVDVGRLCSAAFVDGHVHLDRSYLWSIP